MVVCVYIKKIIYIYKNKGWWNFFLPNTWTYPEGFPVICSLEVGRGWLLGFVLL